MIFLTKVRCRFCHQLLVNYCQNSEGRETKNIFSEKSFFIHDFLKLLET